MNLSICFVYNHFAIGGMETKMQSATRWLRAHFPDDRYYVIGLGGPIPGRELDVRAFHEAREFPLEMPERFTKIAAFFRERKIKVVCFINTGVTVRVAIKEALAALPWPVANVENVATIYDWNSTHKYLRPLRSMRRVQSKLARQRPSEAFDVLTSPWASCTDYMRACFTGANRVTTVLDGVDVDVFRPEICQPYERIVVVMACVSFVKNPSMFFRTADRLSHLPQIRFKIIGDVISEAPEEWKQQFREAVASRRIECTGIKSYQSPEHIDALKGAWLYLVTSYREGQSNAMMEGMAAGLPVISTPVGDHERMLRMEPPCGWIVEHDDDAAAAEIIERLYHDPEEWVRASRAAFQRIRNQGFRLKEMCRRSRRVWLEASLAKMREGDNGVRTC